MGRQERGGGWWVFLGRVGFNEQLFEQPLFLGRGSKANLRLGVGGRRVQPHRSSRKAPAPSSPAMPSPWTMKQSPETSGISKPLSGPFPRPGIWILRTQKTLNPNV